MLWSDSSYAIYWIQYLYRLCCLFNLWSSVVKLRDSKKNHRHVYHFLILPKTLNERLFWKLKKKSKSGTTDGRHESTNSQNPHFAFSLSRLDRPPAPLRSSPADYAAARIQPSRYALLSSISPRLLSVVPPPVGVRVPCPGELTALPLQRRRRRYSGPSSVGRPRFVGKMLLHNRPCFAN
jgi:hypothetical protein